MNAALLQYTISGMMPLIIISILGAVLAKKNIFTEKTIKSISTSFTNFFSPVFAFFNIAGSINIENISELWPLFLTPSIIISFGYIISCLHSKIFKQTPNLSNVITCILTFSNIGNMPIVLMKGICSPYGPLKGNKYCDDANSYVSIQILTYSAIMWSIGNSLIENEKNEHSHSLLTQKLINEGKETKKLEDIPILRTFTKGLLLPGPIACFCGLMIGIIPGIRERFYNKNEYLYVVIDSFLFIGISGVVITQMILGANLILFSSSDKDISKSFIASIVVFKNLLNPICALGFIYLCRLVGVFGDNTVMAYIVFISFCCPTAIVVMVLTQNHQHGTKETARLMIWIYIFSAPCLIIYSYLFFLFFD